MLVTLLYITLLCSKSEEQKVGGLVFVMLEKKEVSEEGRKEEGKDKFEEKERKTVVDRPFSLMKVNERTVIKKN